MNLPTEKTKPKQDFQDMLVLLYGASKIGKSTFCSQAKKPLFLATEAGLNCLETYQITINNWQEFLNACKLIAEGKHTYDTIVIDTVDNLYKMCVDYINKKHNIEHEGDLGFGKGYAFINNEFQRAINKLSSLPYGLIFISHSMEKEFETRTGKKVKIIPTLGNRAREYITGLVDFILYCDFATSKDESIDKAFERVIRTKSSPNFDAGDRTGKLPETIPLDFTEFVKEFSKAIGNKKVVKKELIK